MDLRIENRLEAGHRSEFYIYTAHIYFGCCFITSKIFIKMPSCKFNLIIFVR